MSAVHTPGPWAVSKRGARWVTTTQGIVICNAVLRNSGSPKRGIKHGAKEVLEAEANAHLIAAAPELLAELRETRTELSLTRTNIMSEMQKGEGAAYRWEGVPELLKQRLERIDAVLARATGQEGGAL